MTNSKPTTSTTSFNGVGSHSMSVSVNNANNASRNQFNGASNQNNSNIMSQSNIQAEQKPDLIILAGRAGSGKTYLARELAKNLTYAFVDKDTITGSFTDFITSSYAANASANQASLESARKQIETIEYQTTFKVCKDLLESQKKVILAIPFTNQIDDWFKWTALRNSVGIKPDTRVQFIWVDQDIEQEKENILTRGEERDRDKIKNWDNYIESVKDIVPADEYKAIIFPNDFNKDITTRAEELEAML